MGLSACWRLAEAGHEVFGFDRYPAGHANGSSHGDTRIFRGSPGEGEVYRTLATEARLGWRELEDRSGQKLIDWRTALIIGPPSSAFVAGSLPRPNGLPLSAVDIARRTNGGVTVPDTYIAALQPDAGVIRADLALVELGAAAEAAGAVLERNTEVALAPDTGSLMVGNAGQHFDRVVLTAGPWTPHLFPALAPQLKVTRKTLAWFRARVPLANFPIVCIDDETGLFSMPTPEGLIKIGLDAVGEVDDILGDDGARSEADAEPILAAARHYFPTLDPEPVRIHGCRYTSTANQNFLIVPAGNTLVVSCCSGHGFKYGPAIGEAAANWVDGRKHTALTAFGPEQIIEPVHLGRRS